MSAPDVVGVDFVIWLDRAKPGGFIAWPERRAGTDLAQQTLLRGTHHGRITLWLWQGPNRVKMAFAMARLRGEGGEKPVKIVRGVAPPYRDDDKAQEVFKGERE